MTAAKVIEEMDELPPEDQIKVIQHAFKLARTRALTGEELGKLAQRMVESDDPLEVERLKSAIARGFYGD